MLHVIHDRGFHAEVRDGVQEGGDRTVAYAGRLALHGLIVPDVHAAIEQAGLEHGIGTVLPGTDGHLEQLQPTPRLKRGVMRIAHDHTGRGHAGLFDRQILVLEQTPDIPVLDFLLGRVSVVLHDLVEFDLQTLGQVKIVVGLEQVGHAALAGLRVDANDGLVRAADVLRVDRQVRHEPHEAVKISASALGGHLTSLETLLDGVLMRAGERGEHEVAGIWVALGDLDLVAVFNRLADLGHVGQVKLRVDALGEPVEAQRDQVDVAGTLAVAQQAAFHAVGAGQHGQLGGSHAHAFVVVRVQGEHHGVTVVEVGGNILHFVGEHVRRGHFHGGGQVDDHRVLGSRLDNTDHGVAHLDGVLRLGAGEGFRRVLIVQVDALGLVLEVLAQFDGVGGELLDLFLVLAEHDLALQHRHGVVEVHDGALGTLKRLVCAADEVLAALGEHHDGHVVRDKLTLDEHTDEVEIGLGSGREAHLDLLESHGDKQIPEPQLALGIHRIDEGLIAVAKIDGAPARRALQSLARPRALRVIKRDLLAV